MRTSNGQGVPLGFTGGTVPAGTHFCYIFSDESERLKVMAKFVDSGIGAGEKVVYVADTISADELLSNLRQMGVNTDSSPGKLSVFDAIQLYPSAAHCRPDQMLKVCQDLCTEARAQGYSNSRGTGEMTWCLKPGTASLADVLEYETRLNSLLAEYPSTICCQYDARSFSGEMLMDVLHVHPAMVIRGQLVHNPFYLEPARFLEELRSRNRVSDAVRAATN